MFARVLVSLLAFLIAISQARAIPVGQVDWMGGSRAATATVLFSAGAVPFTAPYCCEATVFLAPPVSFAAMLAAIPPDGQSTAVYDNATNTVTIDARPDANGVAVLFIDTGLFHPNAAVDVHMHGATSVLINVAIATCRHMPCAYTFEVGLRFNNIMEFADRVVWNFPSAAAVTFDAAFGGAVVLPLQQSRMRSVEEGVFAVRGFLNGGQLRRYSFADIPPGAVLQPRVSNPEPSCWCY